MDSRDDSFLDDLADELVWGRLLAVDPALPECLGGTVILLGKMRPWCVKRGMPSRAGTGESASSPLKRGFQGLSIFKSLHNYHYGTFIIIRNHVLKSHCGHVSALLRIRAKDPMCFSVPYDSAGWQLSFNLWSRSGLFTVLILIYRRGRKFWRSICNSVWLALVAEKSTHLPATVICHALAPEAALTYNTANTGFTQARSLHGLCQQLLQLYTVSYS